MTYQQILGVVPTIQSAHLVGTLASKKRRKKPIKNAVDAIVGTSLIRTTAQFI